MLNNDDKSKNTRWGFKVWFPILWLVIAFVLMVVMIILAATGGRTPAA